MSKMSKRLAVLAALAAILASIGVRGATPSEGTINAPADDTLGERAKLTYQGSALTGALLTADLEVVCGVLAAPPSCDEYLLHLNLPTDYYKKRLGKVTARLEVTMDYSDAPNAEQMDMDVLVFNAAGEQVGAGTNGAGTTVEKAVVLAPTGGDYRIVAAASLGTVPNYKGTIRFILERASKITTVLSNAIKFGSPTVVNPNVFGGEPAVTTDPTQPSAWWIDWPIGTRSALGQLYRSLDGGDTFRLITNPACPERRAPGCMTHGGGDTMTQISKTGVIYWANQEALANEAVNVSVDHGITWPADRENAVTSLDAPEDRQWLATYGDNLAWISASVTGQGTGLARTEDGGKTWQSLTPGKAEVPGLPASAPMIADETGGPNDGTLYMLGRGLQFAVSRDKGETFKVYPNTDQPDTGPAAGTAAAVLGTPPPWMSMDRAGNLYVVWTEAADGAAYLSTMKASAKENLGANVGSTWSKPVRVSIPPAVSVIFTQVTSGDPGRIGITYQGANYEGSPSDGAAGTPWYVYAAFSTDALCQWDKSCPDGPSFRQMKVTERANHLGNICVNGTLCAADPTADRSLLDYFDIDVDRDGRVGITYTDDNHGVENTPVIDRNGYIMFAKIAAGPSLRAGHADFGSSFSAASLAPGSVIARAGDAVWPINDTGGKNFPTLDLLAQSVKSTNDALNITVNLASTDNLADGLNAGYGGEHVKYLTRWSYGNDVYFVAADTTGAAPEFYGGKIDANDEMLRTAGTTIYGTTYVRDFDVMGTIGKGTISFTVPRGLVGSPKNGSTLYSMQSFTLVGPPDAQQTIYTSADTIDASPAMDYTVGALVQGARVATAPAKPKPAPKPQGRQLPATGVADTRFIGLVLVAGAAAFWRRARRAVS